jgi:hypothetical protein
MERRAGSQTRRHFLTSAAISLAAVLGPSGRALAALERGARAAAPVTPRFRSRPDLDPPSIAIATGDASASGGHLFAAPFHAANTPAVSQYGPLIVDTKGNPIWFKPLPEGTSATAFRVQQYQGKPVLTWWEGQIGAGYGQGEYVIADGHYRELRRLQAGNGFDGDLHEFLLTDEGTALVTIYDLTTADLGPVGGPSPGLLLDSIVQEIDVKSGRVLFEWHSKDSVPFGESYALLSNPDKPWDHFHVNSVDLDSDGNLLVSSRHTSTIYKLDRRSGDIVWRLGGKSSDFELGDGATFGWQHDARRQPDGTITLFDNAANGAPTQQLAQQSRGLVLELDMNAMTASVVREYLHPSGLLAMAMGNTQMLPSGNAFIGWGMQPHFTGFNAEVQLDLDADLPAGGQSYRAFRQPWVGRPTDTPAIATVAGRNGTTVYASWNGATEVAYWRVLAGPYADELRPLQTSLRQGFETAIAVPVRTGFVAVEALDTSRRIVGASKPRLLTA